MMINNCFPVVAITSLRGDPQVFFYETVMFCPVKPPPKMIDEGIVLVTDEEFNGVERSDFPPLHRVQDAERRECP